jgi:hypothetical protein
MVTIVSNAVSCQGQNSQQEDILRHSLDVWIVLDSVIVLECWVQGVPKISFAATEELT